MVPSKFKALAALVLAVITKLYVGLVQSLLAMLTMALAEPDAVGVKAITNDLVALAAKLPTGLVVTLNCKALAPLNVILLTDKVPVPEF